MSHCTPEYWFRRAHRENFRSGHFCLFRQHRSLASILPICGGVGVLAGPKNEPCDSYPSSTAIVELYELPNARRRAPGHNHPGLIAGFDPQQQLRRFSKEPTEVCSRDPQLAKLGGSDPRDSAEFDRTLHRNGGQWPGGEILALRSSISGGSRRSGVPVLCPLMPGLRVRQTSA